jgi:hypothetical protein
MYGRETNKNMSSPDQPITHLAISRGTFTVLSSTIESIVQYGHEEASLMHVDTADASTSIASYRLHVFLDSLPQASLDVHPKGIEVVQLMPRSNLGRDSRAEGSNNRLR